MTGINPLVLMVFLPLVGAIVVACISPRQKSALRWVTFAITVITFGLSVWVLSLFDASRTELSLVTDVPWFNIAGISVRFFLGVDGLSILLILLTTLLTPLAILSTWRSIQEHVKSFMLLFLLLETSMLGVFAAEDLVLFYVFWEFTLIPMYFLIGVWGSENRLYAAIKFFLYTMAGSIFLLLGLIYVGWQAGTFAIPDLIAKRSLFANAQTWLFLAFGIAFAIKVPMWPLHSWLPDAHTEAPTAGSVILAGVLLKMGAYGFIRINLPLFPQATLQFAPWMAGLAIVGILYGAWVSYRQRDFKRLVAFSSVSHLGFVVLGIFALSQTALAGSILQMVNHGLSTGALFLIVGMLYDRLHTRDMAAFGGLWKVMPVYGSLAIIVTLSSVGLPGLNGFVGEFSILAGTFNSPVLNSPWFAGVATLGVILAAIYLFTMIEKVFLGPVTHSENLGLKDLSAREIATLAPLLVLIFWIGIYPKPFFNLITPAVGHLVSLVQTSMVALP